MRWTEHFNNYFNIYSKRKNMWKFLYHETTFFMRSFMHIQQYEQGAREGKNDKIFK